MDATTTDTVGMAEYKRRLRSHDWTFEWSDDARVVAAGRESLRWLRERQPSLDPDGRWWNAIAPEGFRIHR